MLTPSLSWALQADGCIPPSVLLPEKRLLHLLSQAQEHQQARCPWHNNPETPFSLLHDRNYERSDVPSCGRQVLTDHTDEVWFVQFSACGRYLASASKDATCIVWDVSAEGHVSRRHTLYGHSQAVSYLAWSPTMPKLLTCGKDHQITYWDAEEGTAIHSFLFHDLEVS